MTKLVSCCVCLESEGLIMCLLPCNQKHACCLDCLTKIEKKCPLCRSNLNIDILCENDEIESNKKIIDNLGKKLEEERDKARIKEFTCDICDTLFVTKDLLKNHRESEHSKHYNPVNYLNQTDEERIKIKESIIGKMPNKIDNNHEYDELLKTGVRINKVNRLGGLLGSMYNIRGDNIGRNRRRKKYIF